MTINCERCESALAVYQVDVLGDLIKSCDACLEPRERREIEEGRREYEYAKLHPRDVVEAEGGGNV